MADEIAEVTAVKDQLWRGKIIKLSEVDSGGNIEMIFDILDANTGEVIHPAISVTGSPDDIIRRAQAMAIELRMKKEQAETIKAGDEFEI